MSGRILIEEHDVDALGLPVGAKHLYLVYREDGTGAEFVIRSGPEDNLPFGGEMKIEVNVPIDRSADDRDGDTPRERSSTELSFPGLTDDQAWSIMVQYSRGIDAAHYSYVLLQENSNAFVGAMLHAAHGVPSQMLPIGISAAEAVGFTYWPEIVRDVPPPADWVFRGTAGADALTGLQMDEQFALLAGNDILRAGRGNDLAMGDTGNDMIYGQGGNDRLNGQGNADTIAGQNGNDRLFGSGGADSLAGGPGADFLAGGPSSDRLIGGAGADVFDFAADAGRDQIADFREGTDRLRIHAAAVQDLGDLQISVEGDGLRVAFEGTVVILHGVTPAEFDAGDVVVLPADTLLS